MAYQVELQPLAERDLEEAYLWVANHAPETAARWLARFHEALSTLRHNPQRCGLAPEHKKTKRELRQFLFGKRPNVFRAVFLVEGQAVRVLRIRRASRRQLKQKELGDS